MTDRTTLTPLFAPGPLWSAALLVLAFFLTIALFSAVNSWVEDRARVALQVPAARQVLLDLKTPAAQPGPLNTQSPYSLSAAWGVFDPLASAPAQCTDSAPLVALLKGLACIETAFRQETLRLPEQLQMEPVCNFESFAFGIPSSKLFDTRSPADPQGIDATMDKLLQTVLGVEPATESWRWTGVRRYARDRALGAEVSQKKMETVFAAWAKPDGEDLGLLYWIYLAQDAPEALKANPACRALRDAFDGFAENVLSAHRRVQETAARQRWTLRSMNGPLQFVMIVLFLWGILRLGTRRFKGRWTVPPAEMVLLLWRGLNFGDRLIQNCRSMWPGGAKKQKANEVTGNSVLKWANWVIARDNESMAGARWCDQISAYGSAGSAEAAIATAQDISEKALERWLAEVIPMLGFLGTVIGMILAMQRVGEVVAASPGVELDAAMDGITGALSVAFFTTFIGLIASLILILLQGLQAAWEHDRIRIGLQSNAGNSPSSGKPVTTPEEPTG